MPTLYERLALLARLPNASTVANEMVPQCVVLMTRYGPLCPEDVNTETLEHYREYVTKALATGMEKWLDHLVQEVHNNANNS